MNKIIALTMSILMLISNIAMAPTKSYAAEVGPFPYTASDIEVIFDGSYDAYAKMKDGKIVTWRYDYGVMKKAPSIIEGIDNATNVASSMTSSQNYAIMPDKTLMGWGNNAGGTLGINRPDITSNTIPLPVVNLANVKKIITNNNVSLALLEDGTVWGWGSSSGGMLAPFGATAITIPKLLPNFTGVKDISIGSGHILLLDETNTVWSWGVNNNGQLGINSTTSNLTPTKLSSLTNVKSVLAVNNSSFAIKNDGSIMAWGNNEGGQLGIGNTTNKLIPGIISGISNVSEFRSNGSTSYAVLNDGKVYQWGYLYKFNPTYYTTAQDKVMIPTENKTLSNVASMSIMSISKYFIHSDGSIDVISIVNVEPFDFKYKLVTEIENVDRIENGYIFTLDGKRYTIGYDNRRSYYHEIDDIQSKLITSNNTSIFKVFGDGTVFADTGTQSMWNYQLGTGGSSSISKQGRFKIAALTGAKDIVFKNNSYLNGAYALMPDGRVKAWGANTGGSLGVGHSNVVYSPTYMPDVAGVTKITPTGFIMNDGTVMMLDNPTRKFKTVPGVSNVKNLTIGTFTHLALTEDGKVYMIQTQTKEYPSDFTGVSNQFTLYEGLSDVKEISGTTYAAFFVMNDGTVKSMGTTVSGALGLGLTTVSKIPTTISGLENIRDVNIFGPGRPNTIFAITNDNKIIPWGVNMVNYYSDNVSNMHLLGLGPDVGNKLMSPYGVSSEIPVVTIEKATAAVEKVEISKSLADYNTALDLVTKLVDSSEKTALTNRLEIIITLINYQKSLDSIRAKINALTDVTGKESIEAEIALIPMEVDRFKLQGELDMKIIQLNDASELAKTVIAEDAVKLAEQTLSMSSLTNAKLATDTLKNSLKKTSLLERISVVEEIINSKELIIRQAVEHVLLAESEKTQSSVDTAKIYVEKIQDETKRQELLNRLTVVEDIVKLQVKVSNARMLVEKAEMSKLAIDILNAKISVGQLPVSTDKTELTNRIKALEAHLAAIKDATNKVEMAELTKREPYIANAYSIVNSLIDGPEKNLLLSRLDVLSSTIAAEAEKLANDKAVEEARLAIKTAETTLAPSDVFFANNKITVLPPGPVKDELTSKVNEIEKEIAARSTKILEATAAVVNAELSKLQTDVDFAKNLVNALHDCPEKIDLLNRLAVIQQEINASNEVAAENNKLLMATSAVVKAENSLLVVDVNNAKTLVNGLKSSEDKTRLADRITVLESLILAIKEATSKVLMAESVRKESYVVNAYSSVNALPEITVKQELITRLKAIEKEIADAKALEELNTKVIDATNAVISAEKSQLSSDVVIAKEKTNLLPDGAIKDALVSRILAVETIIANKLAAIAAATEAVQLAEISKTQSDLDSAMGLVNKLHECPEKSSLAGRLLTLQKNIDEEKARLEQLNKINAANQALLIAEESFKVTDLNAAKAIITTINEGPEKTDLTTRAAAVDSIIKLISDAQSKTNTALTLKKEPYITSAYEAVNLLPSIAIKDTLTSQLKELERVIAEVKALEELNLKISEATAAVKIAETSLLLSDIQNAKEKVSLLPEGSKKTDLNDRIQFVENVLATRASKIQEATNSVITAEGSLNQTQLNDAKILVNALHTCSEKTELLARISTVQKLIDEAKAKVEFEAKVMEVTTLLELAEQSLVKTDSDNAKKAIATLIASPEKTSLNDRLVQLEALLAKIANASLKVSNAESLKSDAAIADGFSAVNALPDIETHLILTITKAKLIERLEAIVEAKATPSKATQALIDSLIYNAENLRREPHLSNAYKSINALAPSEYKTNYLFRMDTLMASINGTTISPERKAELEATAAVERAETYKYPVLIRQATTIVNELPNSLVKTSLAQRISLIK